ncbi:MAG: type I-C CRISPR-associated protein Cas8c/Csd1 [Dysgonamonadaceae bacterium]|jgi:CRISPR-associated protein Csd1|nr:type I-C CRISPR-associated protein Cas8c/Csd1 [Dysgonamonadaceae bacterium]
MIKALSEYGKRIRAGQAEGEGDAIAEIPLGIDLLIKPDGSFNSFLVLPDNKTTRGEAITAKKGKARLLLDRAEEVLSYNMPPKKHQYFLKKLSEYKKLSLLKPVFLFYYDNKTKGLDAALQVFEKQVDKKFREKNIAFRLVGETERLHEKKAVIDAVIDHYEKEQQSAISNKRCSICGKTTFPVIDEPHGMIKRVPQGQPTGSALVSYNEKAFESYGLTGNENSSICTNCAHNYVEGLNALLSDGHKKTVKDKNGKEKDIWVYKNRRDFYRAEKKDKKKKNENMPDTTILYWTRENSQTDEIDWADESDEGEIGKLLDSAAVGNEAYVEDSDVFYSCTISGAGGRIAIRDWLEISLKEYRQNITKWFKDIEIRGFDFTEKTEKTYHPSIRSLAKTVKREEPTSTSDMLQVRISTYLWMAAVKHTRPPLWILHAVLKQSRYIEYFESGGEKKTKEPITKERAALIRLILNRNNQGGIFMSTKLDQSNKVPAYVCGQIFSVLVDLQKAAHEGNVNAGIRERFFSFAATMPATAFGRLMPLSQKHLSKLKNSDKLYLYSFFDKELREVCADLKHGFPHLLTLEEQGQFALGYYHKKHETSNRVQDNEKLHDVLETKEEEADGSNNESL